MPGAFYDELSFTNGLTPVGVGVRPSAAPVLYALEYLFRKDGMGKEVALSVFHQARSLVLHLTEVQQCAEKAQEVIKLLSSRKQDKAAEAKADAKAKPPAPTPPKEAPDLLDMSAPVAATAPAVASPAASLATVDLLGEPTVTSVTPVPATPSPAPSIQNLPAPAAPHEKLASSGCGGALAPSEALALALSSAPMAATATLPQDLDLLAPASPPKGRPSSGEVGNLFATASTSSGGGIAAMGGMAGLAAPDVKVMAKAQAPPPAPFGRAHYLGGPPIGGKLGNPYMPIPSTIDLPSQPPVDQFAFVSDITGIGDLAKPAK
ncbi:unnamed protein product [Symbiodinium natans]|uniref:Uncharacterized protein n=1 Tax=Symbiodinium natans TaxID=878477 RepID=A0A812Q6M5_9DINO|nr:unnamed protein product [Symbiodinium natans]